jgi:hypothetical protein
MIPSEQQDLLVGKLISGTQSGALRWTYNERSGKGLLPCPRTYLESRSDGLIFRLSQENKDQVNKKARTIGLLSSLVSSDEIMESQITLDIIDEENFLSKETLYEAKDLPALKQLYEIASERHEALQRKLTAFLGKKAG